MSKLTIVAHITLHPDKVDFVKTEMAKMFPITRAEEGCLQYDLHQDNKNPAYFMIYENWTSYETWQAHMNAEHMAVHCSHAHCLFVSFHQQLFLRQLMPSIELRLGPLGY
jgi:quinol monooxygenase YgiN